MTAFQRFSLLCLLLTISLPAFAGPIYFLGPDRGVYFDGGRGLQRLGLGTGSSFAVRGRTLYLVGDDARVWSGEDGRLAPLPGLSQVQKVVLDPNGGVTVLALDGGVYRQDGRRVGMAVARDLAVAANGDLYVLGTDGRVWIQRAMPGSQWAPYNPVAQGKKIAVSPSGDVFIIGTDDGVYRVGPKQIQRLGLASGQSISVGPDGQVGIVGTDGGVYLFEGPSRWRRLGAGTARMVVWPR